MAFAVGEGAVHFSILDSSIECLQWLGSGRTLEGGKWTWA